jgi:hypothetical protein
MKIRSIARPLVALVLVASSAVAQSSRGDSPRSQRSSHPARPARDTAVEYRFDDDDLLSAGWSAYGDAIHGPTPTLRSLLIHPRTSFVPELLVSVQTL